MNKLSVRNNTRFSKNFFFNVNPVLYIKENNLFLKTYVIDYYYPAQDSIRQVLNIYLCIFLQKILFELLESYYKINTVEAGCDEAGRGCLAGPVVAAAVILAPDYKNDKLNDSKKLSEKDRYNLREEIEKNALAHAVAFIDNEEIDQINILKASIKAMHEAIVKLAIEPEHLIIDGNKFYPFKNIPYTCIIKGDGKYYSIAAASILAKTYRDDFMKSIASDYKPYKWEQNKGYPTKAHREAIKKYGVTEHHRKTFQLLDKQLELNFG